MSETLRYLQSESAETGVEIGTLVKYLLMDAVKARASDIHIEPWESTLAVRIRLNGVLTELVHLPLELMEKISGRFKVLANLVTYQTGLPQEGHVPADPELGGIEQRISIFPTVRANRDPEMIEAITGRLPKVIGGVAIQDVELCVQRIEQTPATIPPGSPAELSVREILEQPQNWGKDSGFETYVIRPSLGDIVAATLFKLSPQEKALLANWEMLEEGWFQEMKVDVRDGDGLLLPAVTDGLGKGQEIDRQENGGRYANYLNDQDKTFRVAESTRREYLARQNQSQPHEQP